MKQIIFTETHNSSTIDKTTYIPIVSELTVTFKNGASYMYPEFSQADYDDFMNSESKGSYFGKVIRKNFTATKLENNV